MSRPLIHASLEDPWNAWGGIGTALRLMRGADLRAGAESYLICVGSGGLPTRAARRLTVSVDGATSAGDVYRSPKRLSLGSAVARVMFSRLEDLASPSEVDLLIHNEELVDLARLATRSGARVYYYAHGMSAQEHPSDVDLDDLQTLMSEAVRGVAVATSTQRSLMAHHLGVDVRTVTLPLELLLDEIERRGMAGRSSAAPPLAILASGRMVPQKGFDLLIKGLKELSGLDVVCSLVTGHGDAEFERECRALAPDSPIPVVFLPWQGRAELLRSIATCDLLAVPSRFEPLGLIAAEGIAADVPVVGSAIGGLGPLLCAAGSHVVPFREGKLAPKDLGIAIREELTQARVPSPGRDALRQWSVQKYRHQLAVLLEDPCRSQEHR